MGKGLICGLGAKGRELGWWSEEDICKRVLHKRKVVAKRNYTVEKGERQPCLTVH